MAFKLSHMEFELEPRVQTHSIKHVASCISSTTTYCHVMIMHHIVHCIDCVSSSVAGGCSPSVDVCSDDEIVDTDEDSMLSSEVPGKRNPLVHSDKIPLSRPCSLLLH